MSATQATAPYPTASASAPRNAAIWSSAQDEILLQAKASGMNWQPIANRYFPNKSANACRKRHERLKSAREAEEWDAEKLESLAQQYLAVREEMWSRLAQRVGEPWKVVEAKVSALTIVAIFRSTNETTSAWKRVSKPFRPQLAQLKGELRRALAIHTMSKVSQTTTVTLALGWAQTLRWR